MSNMLGDSYCFNQSMYFTILIRQKTFGIHSTTLSIIICFMMNFYSSHHFFTNHVHLKLHENICNKINRKIEFDEVVEQYKLNKNVQALIWIKNFNKDATFHPILVLINGEQTKEDKRQKMKERWRNQDEEITKLNFIFFVF